VAASGKGLTGEAAGASARADPARVAPHRARVPPRRARPADQSGEKSVATTVSSSGSMRTMATAAL